MVMTVGSVSVTTLQKYKGRRGVLFKFEAVFSIPPNKQTLGFACFSGRDQGEIRRRYRQRTDPGQLLEG
jgi:hypothetical protein